MPDIPVDRFVPDPDPVASWKSWTEHLAPVFEAYPVPETHAGPSVGMRSYNLGSVLVGEVSAPAQRLERSARMVERQGVDHVLIQLYRSGTSTIRTDRSETRINPSDFVLYDLAQPVTISSSAVAATNILVPRGLLGARAGLVDSLHGHRFSVADDRVTQLFAAYLGDVVASCEDLTAQQAPGVAQAAASLCAAALPSPAGDVATTKRRTSLAIRAFIQDNLGVPELGPEMICARFGLSRATLYRQFAADDGVQSYIRNRRLAQAMRMLTDPAADGRPRISSVAYATGFWDEKTFSRAFRRRFGYLPRDAAAEQGAGPGQSRTSLLLGEWIQQLGW
ncbi:helix-turn-helix domain-containing protein [Methylobacterium sp. MA0201]